MNWTDNNFQLVHLLPWLHYKVRKGIIPLSQLHELSCQQQGCETSRLYYGSLKAYRLFAVDGYNFSWWGHLGILNPFTQDPWWILPLSFWSHSKSRLHMQCCGVEHQLPAAGNLSAKFASTEKGSFFFLTHWVNFVLSKHVRCICFKLLCSA